MIKLKSLELQGFRKFKDLTKIEFPESGLMLLDGDSGAGKSTVLQAIAFAIDVCPYPSTTLKSWSGEKLQVKLTMTENGREVTVSRGAINSIQYDGEPARTGAKALEEGLRKLFGMSPDLLSALTYRPQDTLGLFLAKSDSEKKEFLGKVLNLEVIEKAVENADIKRKDLASKLQFAQGVLAEKEARLRTILDQVGEVSPDADGTGLKQRFDACQAVVNKLSLEEAVADNTVKEAYSVFLTNSDVEKEALKVKLGQARTFLSQFKQANTNSRKEFEDKFSNLKDQVHQVDTELQQINAVRKEVTNLETQLKSLRSNTCYVCHQPFTAELAIDDKEEKLLELRCKLDTEPGLLQRREKLLAFLPSLKWTPDEREGKFSNIIIQLENDIKGLGVNITDQRVIKAQEDLAKVKSTLQKAKQDLANSKFDLEKWIQLCELRNSARIKAESNKQSSLSEVDTQRTIVATIESNYNAELDFISILGREGFLGVIFDEVLTEIATQANEILGKLSNTSNVSVHFRTESQKGKKSIVPVFVVGGQETTRNGGLSGGMGTSADLAVDLGVVNVVESRLGSAPGWLCLDETFNGLPKATKESALEILQQFATDRLVLVVDHGTEMKSMFTKVLQVREEDGRSLV